MVFGGPEFLPEISDGDVDSWLQERLGHWPPGSTASFAFQYGDLIGEYWEQEGAVVFHASDCPFVEAGGEEIKIDEDERRLYKSSGMSIEAARFVVRSATRELLQDYYSSWTLNNFNKQQAYSR